ncbi:reverse transcriptase domain-containing protein [Tanacetum coccineum]|uniref:Reverse transcriptase domain-containing protein n=1 Tax=Tanacetum coccineum TaxID=301880 RepID=A0ABQ5D7G8_9ASTR
MIRWILLLQEFDIEIRDKKGVENLTADHLSLLENPDLGKLTKAEIRDLFLEERLMAISNKNNEPWYTESYEGMSPEMRRHKSFDNVTAAHQEGIMILPQPQGKSSKPGFTGQIFSAMHVDWSELAMPVNEPVEAQAFPASDALNVVNFLKRLFVRFVILEAWISDRGTHFCKYQMERVMKRYGVVYRFSTAYYPQTNGQVENTNRAIKRILEKTIRNNRKEWSHKLDDALWAFRTAFKTPLGTTPFRIIYVKACHLRELDEMRLDAYESFISYKERTKRWHDKRIKTSTKYKKGDKVVLDADKDEDIILEDEGEVTKFFKKNKEEIFTDAGDGVMIQPDGVTSPAM